MKIEVALNIKLYRILKKKTFFNLNCISKTKRLPTYLCKRFVIILKVSSSVKFLLQKTEIPSISNVRKSKRAFKSVLPFANNYT